MPQLPAMFTLAPLPRLARMVLPLRLGVHKVGRCLPLSAQFPGRRPLDQHRFQVLPHSAWQVLQWYSIVSLTGASGTARMPGLVPASSAGNSGVSDDALPGCSLVIC
jgi:hypothetical protein